MRRNLLLVLIGLVARESFAGEECAPACETSARPAPAVPWKVRFFNNDFGYRGTPGAPYFYGEELKTMLFGSDEQFSFSTGGAFRYRYLNEKNRLRPGGPGRSTYDQTRFRLYGDLQIRDVGRVYVEGIDSATFNEDLPFLPIDENRWDVLNAFFDLHLIGNGGKNSLTFRAGRQEFLFGAQRFVAPLDWGNTRRNFEGVSLIARGETWQLDLFSVRPVNTATGGRPVGFNKRFDSPDQSRTFQGAYFSFTGFENQTIDLYWLWLNEQVPVAALADGNRHTIGARWASVIKPDPGRVIKAEVEGAYQFGQDNGLGDATLQDIQAGMLTAAVTHTWASVPFSPEVGGLFYWGSGDTRAADGQMNTLSVLFPLGHAYWGIIDNLSGQNLIDLGLITSIKPHKKLTLLAAVHRFRRATSGDAIYNVGGVPVGGRGGANDIGTELDLVATFTWNAQFMIQAGYSRFWYDDAVTGNPLLVRGDASQFYVLSRIRF